MSSVMYSLLSPVDSKLMVTKHLLLTFRNISNIGQQQLRITKRLILTHWRASVLTKQKISLLYVYTKWHVCSEMTVLPIRRNSHLLNWSFCPYEVCHFICWWLLRPLSCGQGFASSVLVLTWCISGAFVCLKCASYKQHLTRLFCPVWQSLSFH